MVLCAPDLLVYRMDYGIRMVGMWHKLRSLFVLGRISMVFQMGVNGRMVIIPPFHHIGCGKIVILGVDHYI